MFREMRRRRQQLAQDVCTDILQRNTAGVLALHGDDGYPYAVPLSYVYVPDAPDAAAGGAGHDGAALTASSTAGTGAVPAARPPLGRIVFHCARSGHKIDAIARNPKASFCVIDRDQVVPAEFTTYFRSVIAFGRVRVIDDEVAKRAAIELLAKRYSPDESPESVAAEIDGTWRALCMLELVVEHLTGKEAKELLQARG